MKTIDTTLEHLLNQTIMNEMARIEGNYALFQEMHPLLDAQIWSAIDSRNIARLNSIIKQLGDL